MTAVSNPKVTLIEEGEKITIKQMEAYSGQLLPEHKASDESVLVVLKGECNLKLAEKDHLLGPGSSLVIPHNVWHQIKVIQDFKALHVMPKDILFVFTK
ncbi:MAG TPA: cupin domain-containing protein [Fulvivirga sp.]|nr:cupin domain-containing protein [Fulvivirga sp.]